MYDSTTAYMQSANLTIDTKNPTASFTPIDGATEVGINDNLIITFHEAVDTVSDSIWIKYASDSTVFEGFAVSDAEITGTGTATITINPSGPFDGDTTYFVQISSSAFNPVS